MMKIIAASGHPDIPLAILFPDRCKGFRHVSGVNLVLEEPVSTQSTLVGGEEV